MIKVLMAVTIAFAAMTMAAPEAEAENLSCRVTVSGGGFNFGIHFFRVGHPYIGTMHFQAQCRDLDDKVNGVYRVVTGLPVYLNGHKVVGSNWVEDIDMEYYGGHLTWEFSIPFTTSEIGVYGRTFTVFDNDGIAHESNQVVINVLPPR